MVQQAVSDADSAATITDFAPNWPRAGATAAIDSLLRQIRPMVVRYCRSRLGSVAGHSEVAEDVAQEVCITILTALPRYQDLGRPFASFVFGIASHKVTDARRSAARLAIPTQDLPDDHLDPEESVVASLEAQRAQAPVPPPRAPAGTS